jgi:hypothetical protein
MFLIQYLVVRRMLSSHEVHDPPVTFEKTELNDSTAVVQYD